MDNGAMDNGANKANFDPLAEASRLWEEHYGPSEAMAVVTSAYGSNSSCPPYRSAAPQLRPHLRPVRSPGAPGVQPAHSLPMSIMGQRLMVHQTSVTSVVDRLKRTAWSYGPPIPLTGARTLVRSHRCRSQCGQGSYRGPDG